MRLSSAEIEMSLLFTCGPATNGGCIPHVVVSNRGVTAPVENRKLEIVRGALFMTPYIRSGSRKLNVGPGYRGMTNPPPLPAPGKGLMSMVDGSKPNARAVCGWPTKKNFRPSALQALVSVPGFRKKLLTCFGFVLPSVTRTM